MTASIFTEAVTPGMQVESLETRISTGSVADLGSSLDTLNEYHRRLMANRRYGVLLVVQGLDAAGKDSLIRTLAQGMDPAGFRVHSFSRPLGEEVHHDFLWRVWRHLPERGEVVAFNRSHYESVLAERLWPISEHASDEWPLKYQSINAFEEHLHREGTRIIKIWLNTSRDEQRKRLVKRLDKPRKRWKFDDADIRSWEARADYLQLVNEVLPATHTEYAPWHVIPNDDKPAARAVVAAILAESLKSLAPEYPREHAACIARYRELLLDQDNGDA
ncbi:polyphosphate kinase 2 family protein [Alcanivorax sp. DP30]|uniref:polyphosphate kinase 2 family protein n=1 Tax=Alcanivorax sp. DP30 TaxID=2606217 RepID=UPI001F323411|nr:PPK2 family polyphosphate kinase [Alcanivorax sp. DP30]